jgi:hypothetical protein
MAPFSVSSPETIDVSKMTELAPYFETKPLASMQVNTSFKFSVGALTSELDPQDAKTATDKRRMIFFMVTELYLKLPKLLHRSKLEIFQISLAK